MKKKSRDWYCRHATIDIQTIEIEMKRNYASRRELYLLFVIEEGNGFVTIGFNN